MFQPFFISIFESMEGKKIATLIGELSGKSVTERTVRNWQHGKGKPSASQLEAMNQAAQQHLRDKLSKSGWSEVEIAKWFEGLSTAKGFVSSLVWSMSPTEPLTYSHTFALSVQIDALAEQLLAFREADQLRSFAQCLLDSPLLSPQHYIELDDGDATAENLRQTIAEATTWDDLHQPFAVITFNVIIQLLVTLDLEFCTKWLRQFEAKPIFQLLLPCLASHAQPAAGSQLPISRDMFHLPVRRLIDLIACLYCFRKNGKWPKQIPMVAELTRWMNGNEKRITKWRTGRKFTRRHFQVIWAGMFEYQPVAEQPSVPLPLLFAATVFSRLFVRDSRERKNFSMTVFDPDCYCRCWSIQRSRLEAIDKGLLFGDTPWMPALL